MTLRDPLRDPPPPKGQVYDGIVPLLDHVRLTASASFVATLKPTAYAERIVHRLGLAPYFAGVYGAEMEGRFGDDKADLLAPVRRGTHRARARRDDRRSGG